MRTPLLLATHNDGKVQEFARLLPDFALTGARALQLDAPEETGQTFIENALIKARAEPRPRPSTWPMTRAHCSAPRWGPWGVLLPLRRTRGHGPGQLAALESPWGPGDRRAAFYCVLVLMSHPDDPCPRIAEGFGPESALAPEEGLRLRSRLLGTSRRRTAARLAPEEKAASPIGAAPWPPKAQLAERPLRS